MTEDRIKHILNEFLKLKIAVIGDFFLDKWLQIDRSLDEISVETGLTAYQVIGKRIFAGAAGTVLANLSALDIGQLYAVGFIGDDGEGFELLRDLHAKRVNTDLLISSDLIMTPTYTKPMFLADGIETETNRLDFKNVNVTPKVLEDKVIENLWTIAPKVDAIIALDQIDDENHGVLASKVRDELARVAKRYPNLIIYADSRSFIHKFNNVIVKCNDNEVVKTIQPENAGSQDMEIIKDCLLDLSKRTGKEVFVTCGARGVLTMTGDGSVELVKTIPQRGQIDIVGAGDACSAGIVSSLCAGATSQEAACIGNLTSSITIQIIGTTGTASRQGIINRFIDYYGEKDRDYEKI